MRRPGVMICGVAVVSAALLSAGCRGGSTSRAATTTTQVPPTTATTAGTPPTSTSTRTSLAGAGVSPVSTPVAGRALLTAVRVSTNDGFDRVVFEFEGGAPGYSVQYVERPVHADPSDKEVPVAGEAVLQIRMEHAAGADLAGSKFRETYTGPKQIPVNGPAAVEAVQVGDFEGVLRWVIGTHGRLPFTVKVLSAPARITIDIEHPPAPG